MTFEICKRQRGVKCLLGLNFFCFLVILILPKIIVLSLRCGRLSGEERFSEFILLDFYFCLETSLDNSVLCKKR